MGKAKIRKKLLGIQKQRVKHIDKFREAFEREDEGSMNYMGRELTDFSKIEDRLARKLLPKKGRKRK